MRIPGEPLFPDMETAERDEGSPENRADAFLRARKSRMDHSALVEAQNEYAARVDGWTDRAVRERAGAKAADVTRDAVGFHARTVDEIMAEAAMGAAVRDAFRVWAKGRGKALCLRMALFEDKERRIHAFDQHEIRRGGIFLAAEKEPDSFADLLGQLGEIHALSVGQGLFSPEEANARYAVDASALRDAAFESLYREDPEYAVEAMKSLGFNAARQRRERRRLEGDARAAALREEAARRDTARVLADRVEETLLAASMTGEGAALRELARRFMEAGEEDSAKNLARQADFFESHAVSVKESAAMNLPDLRKKILELERAVTGANGTAVRDGMETELALRAAVYAQREQALAEDPAGAVAGNIERETGEETAAYRLAAQERNGVAEGNRRGLTNGEAAFFAGMAKRLIRAGEEELEAALEEFRNSFGRHAGRALAEVTAAMGAESAEETLLIHAEHREGGGI